MHEMSFVKQRPCKVVEMALDIPRGDGEKTLGEVEKAYILAPYIIIPERLLHHEQTLGMKKVNETIFTNYLWARLILTI
jgi:hypothetical protein